MRAFILSLLGLSVLILSGMRVSAAQPDGTPAKIRVTLPADATLTIDGQATKSTSANRWFVTPPLADGKYAYTVKAEFVRDGMTITVEKQVWVRAGQETNVSLNVPAQAVSGYTPDGRALYYDPEAPAPPTVVPPAYYAPPAYYDAPRPSSAPNGSRRGIRS